MCIESRVCVMNRSSERREQRSAVGRVKVTVYLVCEDKTETDQSKSEEADIWGREEKTKDERHP
jgi:hypothetical protein